MQIVIEIPEEVYNCAIDGQLDAIQTAFICGSVSNGKPLPKGHGRLIDVNDLLDDINLEDNDYNRDVNTGEIITLENIDRIPTIIEADREVNND